MLNETMDPTTETLNETTENTTDAVGKKTDSITEETDSTANRTDTRVDETTNGTDAEVDETTNGTDAEVDETTNGTVGVTTPESTPTPVPSTGTSTTAVTGSEPGSDGTPLPPSGGIAIGAVVAGAAGVAVLSAGKSGAVAPTTAAETAATSARAAAAGARAWLSGLTDRLLRIGSLFRYSQWDGSDSLEHDGRAAVFDEVEDSPGIYLSALEERSDDSLSTVRHHLRILESEGLITTEKIRGKRRHFPDRRGGADPALVAAVEDPATERILTRLADEGPASSSDLADAMDRDASTISHHLSRLEAEGLMVRERDGRAVVNRLSDATAVALTDDALAGGDETPAAADD